MSCQRVRLPISHRRQQMVSFNLVYNVYVWRYKFLPGELVGCGVPAVRSLHISRPKEMTLSKETSTLKCIKAYGNDEQSVSPSLPTLSALPTVLAYST